MRQLLVGVYQFALGGLGADALVIEPLAIIAYRDDYPRTLTRKVEVDAAFGRFAGGSPVPGKFDTVIHRIAQQMEQRIGQFIEHVSVHLNIAAGDDQRGLLAGLHTGLAHIARQARSQRADRGETGRNDLMLEFFIDLGLLRHFDAQICHAGFKVFRHLACIGGHFHQRAGSAMQFVIAIHFQRIERPVFCGIRRRERHAAQHHQLFDIDDPLLNQ